MKVVIFCGGLGVRMGEETRTHPEADDRDRRQADPLAHHALLRDRGATTSSFCASATRARWSRSTSSRTTGPLQRLRARARWLDGTRLELLSRDLDEWRITFVDTGIDATIGERLKAVGPLSGRRARVPRDLRGRAHRRAVADMIRTLRETGKTALFLSVRPQFNAHLVKTDDDRHRARGRGHEPLGRAHQRRVLRLPARGPRLDRAGRRTGRGDVRTADRASRRSSRTRTRASWGPMDTIKDRQRLESAPRVGQAPWLVFA